MTVVLKVRFPVDDAGLSALHHRAFSPDRPEADVVARAWASRLERHSLTWVGAFSAGRLVGFVHAVWDGGTHAFILDTAVHPDFQRLGIGRNLVRAVTDEAFKSGCEWVHVDYEPQLASFYENACGFRPTAAGLRSAARAVRLRPPMMPASAQALVICCGPAR
jgi:GNAT superfamily N-acetyltransferase